MEIADITSLEELTELLTILPEPHTESGMIAGLHEEKLTKPLGALGRLESIIVWLAHWQGCYPPKIQNPSCNIFAGNHGVVAQGVSAYPAEVTAQMVQNFEAGGAAINQMCAYADVSLQVIPIRLEHPTRNITEGPAMMDSEFIAAFKIGALSVKADTDLLCVGEMGIGNTTTAAAISNALFGGKAEDWTGPGTGVDGNVLDSKVKSVAIAVEKNICHKKNALEIAVCLGGRELSAIAGAVISARKNRIPVLFDGFVATAALAPFEIAAPGSLDHCMAAHLSAEPAHGKLLKELNKKPILDLGMRLGEGSGAVLAVPILRQAVLCHTGMATFVDAGVSEKI